MQKILTAIAALCLFPIAAQASVLYQFETTGFALGDPGEVEDAGAAFDGIDLTLGFDEAAWQTGAIAGTGTGCNVTEITAFRADGVAFDLCVPDIQGELVELDVQFAGETMTGSLLLSWDEGGEMVVLSSLPSGLWTGTFGSDRGGDGCFGTPCAIEGVWRLVSAVPEPGPLALILTGLGGLLASYGARRCARS